MPLPTLKKTYEFDLNNQVPGDGSGGGNDGTGDRKQLLFEIVTALVNGGTWTVPWTVIGSSNAVASGMDAVNRWASASDVVWQSDGNAHSWIVLSNSGLGVQMLIECRQGNINQDGAGIRIIVSPNGFGTANGGTDGSTTTGPTATDECELRNGFNNADGAWAGADTIAARQFQWHIVASNDGEVWNVLIYHAGSVLGVWRWEKPENPPAGWTTPFVGGCLGTTSDAANADTESRTGQTGDGHFTAPDSVRRDGGRAGQQISGQNNSERTPVRPFTWGWDTGCQQGNRSLTVVHSITGNPMLWPIWWYTPANSMGRGRLGRAYDLWLRQSTVGGNVGDTYPSNPATPQFLVVGESLIIPWDGATAPQIS